MPVQTSNLEFLHNDEPLDENSPVAQAMLKKLQGNILKGHGRDFGVYIFFRFLDQSDVIKKHLGELAHYVTSAYQQHQNAEMYRKFKIPGGLFGMLVLSASGYRYLGFAPEAKFPEKEEMGVVSSFVEGLKTHAEDDFCDPPVNKWEEAYQEEIHAMLLLVDDDENNVLQEAGRAIQELRLHHAIVGVELGKSLRNAEGKGMEHFGYIDGRSQPLYLKSDFGYDDAGKRVSDKAGSGIDLWDPFEPLHRVLIPDPIMPDENHCFGSFLVFRKLEQDVLHFLLREEELADDLGLKGEDRARAGAMAVGRFRDGTPLAVSKTDGYSPEQENNFAYNNLPQGNTDIEGLKCPFQAHIRKLNPRGDIASDNGKGAGQIERQRRIARRGIPYGDRVKDPGILQTLSEIPSSGVGLLFMCFQASIRKQFAFLQKQWGNGLQRPLEKTGLHVTGLDPLVGQANTPAAPQTWAKRYGKTPETQLSFQGFVRMKGGEFFFAPSIPFFDQLKGIG